MNALAVATLVSWLVAEGFGAVMLRFWLRRSAVPRRVYGHAMLAFCGLLGWIGFVLTSFVGLAWLAIGCLALTIGLGFSTLALWSPNPGRMTFGITSDEMLARAVEDEALTTKLVDDLVASVLAAPDPAVTSPALRPALLVHAVHAVLAASTFLFAVLAAVSVS